MDNIENNPIEVKTKKGKNNIVITVLVIALIVLGVIWATMTNKKVVEEEFNPVDTTTSISEDLDNIDLDGGLEGEFDSLDTEIENL